ncbi:protein of unknown function [Candidatus Nitrosocosmicus franklandus]|uniref:Uncharacterized protein n=1 Tax=Candidatus Nitrosocosmicus franklandianus TaxID=1798806 RepID=A0A484IAY9_9ARCH|nr:protein of unknown function [Candidatus Nitrosocosmicus franklandus]
MIVLYVEIGIGKVTYSIIPLYLDVLGNHHIFSKSIARIMTNSFFIRIDFSVFLLESA